MIIIKDLYICREAAHTQGWDSPAATGIFRWFFEERYAQILYLAMQKCWQNPKDTDHVASLTLWKLWVWIIGNAEMNDIDGMISRCTFYSYNDLMRQLYHRYKLDDPQDRDPGTDPRWALSIEAKSWIQDFLHDKASEVNVVDIVERREAINFVDLGLSTLSWLEFRCVWLLFFGEQSKAAIARELDISLRKVNRYLDSGLLKLAKFLLEQYGEAQIKEMFPNWKPQK